MKRRPLQLGMTVVLGLLFIVFASLFIAPATVSYAEAPQRPWLDSVVVTRTIGTGTTTFYYGPFYNNWENNKTQMIYLGSEIGFSGPIRRVAFDVSQVGTSYQTLKNFTIRAMEISTTTVNAAYLDTSAATVVYGGTGYSETLPSVTGWVWFDIADFNFHPDKNLLLEVVWGDNGGYASTYYQVNGTSTSPSYRTVYGYADSETPPLYDGQSYTRPNLRFEMEATAAPLYVATKLVSPGGTRYTGDVVTYTVAFTNTGILTGTTSLNDPIPAGAQYVPGSLTGSTVYSDVLNAVLWGPGSLAPNESVTATFRVTLTATNGSVTNTATISDAAILVPVSASAANTIAVADFSASAKSASGNIHPTGNLTYTIVLNNSAAAITATATMTDPIPLGAAYLPGSASVQGGGTLVADTAGITWTGTVTGGQKVTVTFGTSPTALTAM